MYLRAAKSAIIQDTFVRTADQNYITARWCSANSLHTDFLWLALHSVEKYLKAALLTNGKPCKEQGHDIARLFAEFKGFAGELLPANLPKPRELGDPGWFDRSTDEFVEHLVRYGNPDNRYQIYGYTAFSADLHMLDQLVWSIRRLIVPLDDRIVDEADDGEEFPTFREVLTRQPEYSYDLGFLPLDELIRSKEDSPLRVAALNWNFSFTPPSFQHRPMQGGFASSNPAIGLWILDPLADGDREQVEAAAELARWLIDNVRLPGGRGAQGVRGQIEQAVAEARLRVRPP